MATLHDKLVEFVLSKHEEFSYPSSSRFGKVTAEPEVHYNHYGDRGVVDVVIVKRPKEDQSDFHPEDRCKWDTVTLLEIKAHIEDVGETLRQFKRMRKYFFEDHPEYEPCTKVYELAIYPSRSNDALLEKHRHSFNSLMSPYRGPYKWDIEYGHTVVGVPALEKTPKFEFPPDAWGPVSTYICPFILSDREKKPNFVFSIGDVMDFVNEFQKEFPSAEKVQIAEVLQSETPPLVSRRKAGFGQKEGVKVD